MEPHIYWLFIDKKDSFEFSVSGDIHYYRPSGVVMCFQPPRDRADGFEVGVVYRTPSGRLFRAWRSMREIEFEKTDEKSWQSLYDSLNTAPAYQSQRVN